MKNLILSAACGLDPTQIEFFLKSLRKHYDDEILFLVRKEDFKTKEFLKIYKCQFMEVAIHRFDIQLKRYLFFLNFIKKHKYKNILFCDSRDIYFQANPFDYVYKGSINYFLEDKKIKDCQFNSEWMIKTYGYSTYLDLSENIISCGGTILADHNSMENFLKLMIEELSKHKYKKKLKYILTFRRDKGGRGSDQAHGNYIAHKKLIPNSFYHSNASGPIATAYHLKNIKFNNKSQLINNLNEPYAVVHQYDKRWDKFKDCVEVFKKSLGIK